MPRALDVAHVVYQATDLDRMQDFMQDFGLVVAERRADALFMRAADPAPFVHATLRGEVDRFVGGALRMGAREDLLAIARLPGSSDVEPADDVPGGGWRVRTTTPDGVRIDAVWGQQPAETLPLRGPYPFNSGVAKQRVNHSLRPRREPGLCKRLGHFVLRVSDHDASLAWFAERFGLVAADHLCVPGDPERVIGTFVRFDRGEDLVDHHGMLIVQSSDPTDTGVHHCSFEMQDLDAVMGAHDHLLARGWRLECGVGRHLVGSQIFDYWRDPFGNRVEHYTDGDAVNHLHRPQRYAVAADETTQWGMQPPPEFFD
jgi:catechol 2,3-dioxygenase-like lactoylglutathione lyase family enzyme